MSAATMALVVAAYAQPGGQRNTPQVKPYTDVVTSEAVTKAGVFKTHRVGAKLYFEIPTA